MRIIRGKYGKKRKKNYGTNEQTNKINKQMNKQISGLRTGFFLRLSFKVPVYMTSDIYLGPSHNFVFTSGKHLKVHVFSEIYYRVGQSYP